MHKESFNHGHLKEGFFARSPVDRESIPQDILDIRNKTRSNPLEWQGQFSPQFVEAIIGYYNQKDSVALDPFAGSGTVIVEAIKKGFGAVGVEINPAAFNLANFYSTSMLSPSERSTLRKAVFENTAFLDSDGPLWESGDSSGKDTCEKLVDIWKKSQNGSYVAGLPEFLAALITLTDFHKKPVSEDRIRIVRLRLLNLLDELPRVKKNDINIKLGDARNTGLEKGSVDLVLTSPPYINVYNYHQKYRASVEAMGWNVLQAARTEIGSNRKHRGNRLLTVIQYCLDMTEVLCEVGRVLTDGGHAVFVVGRESMVRKTPFFNGEIIAEIACDTLGYELQMKQERVFLNRFGQSIYEDILHLRPKRSELPTLDKRTSSARDIAKRVLEDAVTRCPNESKEDFMKALEDLPKVQHSPNVIPVKPNVRNGGSLNVK